MLREKKGRLPEAAQVRFPLKDGSRFKVQISHCDRLQRSLLVLRKICGCKTEEDEEERRNGKRQVTKEGRLVVTRKDGICRSSIHLLTIRRPRFASLTISVPDNSCKKVTSATRLREDNTESCRNRGFQQRAKNYLRFRSIPANLSKEE